MSDRVLTLWNAQPAPLSSWPRLGLDEFRSVVTGAPSGGRRVCALFGARHAEGVALHVVLAADEEGVLETAWTVVGDAYPSLTPECPEVHLFEREIAEQWGVVPEGHPWLKPVRFVHSYRPGHDAWGRSDDAAIAVGEMEFFRVEGEEIHEVAVGPVHAGVIEPGHFRFQCHGEQVFHLEISLGYQHRGVERRLQGRHDKRAIHYAETLAGDTTIGHATAYCQALEALGGGRPTPRAHALRAIALELERLANHTGDLGALAGDVGFLSTAAYCGRLRGDFLNMTALLCGNRFGRGLVRTGGVASDAEPERVAELLRRLDSAERDVTDAVGLLWDSASVMARFEETGRVPEEMARLLGLVGPAARASGLRRDVRKMHPAGMFQVVHIPLSTAESGDVFARAYIRWLEIERSIDYVRTELQELPRGERRRACPPPRPGMLVASLVEGWRGEICHVAITDAAGDFSTYKIVDPSFHNWMGLAMALRDQQISDFPLCNKSFNLSYCGHDL